MESFATPFPIFFDDGEGSEPKAMGAIGVHSVLSFKRFQALMSQKINLPAGQLTAVFVCRRAVRHMPPVGWSWVRRSVAAAHRPRRCPRSPRPARLHCLWRRRLRRSHQACAFRGAEPARAPSPQGAEGDKRQKLPVNENTNFNIILNQHHPSKERDAHFLISVKKSKKDRKGAPRCLWIALPARG